MESNYEGCHLQSFRSTSTDDGLSTRRGPNNDWSTSRTLEQVLKKRNDVSSSVWGKLLRDQERISDVGQSHLHNVPREIRNAIFPSPSSIADEGQKVKRWVALHRRFPRMMNRTQSIRTGPKQRACAEQTRSERAGFCPDISGTVRRGHHTTREHSSYSGLPGITTVPFKCPALSPLRKTSSIVSKGINSQLELRRAMRTQIERQRNFVLSKHVEFVSCNTVSGTRVRNPRDRANRAKGNYFSSHDKINIELMAILSVQEFNKPLMSMELSPKSPVL